MSHEARGLSRLGKDLKNAGKIINAGGYLAQAAYVGAPELLKNDGISKFFHSSDFLKSVASIFSEPNSLAFAATFPLVTALAQKRRDGKMGDSLLSDALWLGIDVATVAVAGMTLGGEMAKQLPNVPLLLASLHVLANVGVLRYQEMKKTKGFIASTGRLITTGALIGAAIFAPYYENKNSIDNLVQTASSQFNLTIDSQTLAQIQSLGEPQKGVSAQAMTASADAIDQNVQNVVAETVKGTPPNFVTRALNSVANGARAQDEEVDLIPQVVIAESVKDASSIPLKPIISTNQQPPVNVSPTETPNFLDQCFEFYTVIQSDVDETARIQAILGRDGLGLLEVTARELQLPTIDQIAKGSADQLRLNSAFSAICDANLAIDQGFDCGIISTSQPPICVPGGIR